MFSLHLLTSSKCVLICKLDDFFKCLLTRFSERMFLQKCVQTTTFWWESRKEFRNLSLRDSNQLKITAHAHFTNIYRLSVVNAHVHKVENKPQATPWYPTKFDWWHSIHQKYFVSNNLHHWKSKRQTPRVNSTWINIARRYTSSRSSWWIPVKKH